MTFPFPFACGRQSEAGSQTYTTPGVYSFTVPLYTTLSVQVWGGGGGGGGSNGTANGTAGGQSSFGTYAIANGGGGGVRGLYTNGPYSGGAGGTASNGDTNTTGSTGGSGNGDAVNPPYNCYSGSGGSCPNGGAAVAGNTPDPTGFNGNTGNTPGGGGSGGGPGGGGGGGGYSSRAFSIGALTELSTITVTVGSPGTGGIYSGQLRGGDGAAGKVSITWS